MSRTKEETPLTTAESQAKIFMDEARKISKDEMTILISDLTEKNTLDFPLPAEIRKEFYRSSVTLLGNDREIIKQVKDTIDDLAVSLGGTCGFLVNRGEIETNFKYNPELGDSPFNKTHGSITVYTFGVDQLKAFDEEIETLDFNF